MSWLRTALALVWLAAPALADEADPQARATALFAEGNALAKKGALREALAKFRAAVALAPRPKILLNTATTLRKLGEDVEAVIVYQRYLASGGDEVTDERRAAVDKAIAEIRSGLGRIAVEVNEAGASVLVDDVIVGPSPLGEPVWAKVGPHRVEARKQGFHPSGKSVQTAAGKSQTVRLLLARAVQASAPPPAPVPAAPPPAAARPPAAPAAPRVAAAAPAPRRAGLAHGGRVGAVARLDADSGGDGGAVSLGPTYGLADYVEAGAVAILGSRFGGRVLATVFLLPEGAWKPFATAGLALFLVDGARPGVHAGAGLQYDIDPTLGAFAEVAVEHFPTMPESVDATVLVPTLGAQARW